MAKCAYCNKPEAGEKFRISTWNGMGREEVEFYYCSDACKQEIEDFSGYVNRHAGKFLAIVIVTVLAMVFSGALPALTGSDRYVLLVEAAAIIVLGITMMVLPFATPQTNQWLGIKKAKFITRILGAVVTVSGIYMLVIFLR